MFCSKCGEEAPEGSKFCLYCGTPLVCNTNTEPPVQVATLPEEIRLYIGKNAEYYMQKFNVLSSSGSNISWNWAAFFLNIPWCIYRKMYREGTVLAIISILCGMIPLINILSGIAICVVCGALGNSFYLKHIRTLEAEAETIGLSDELHSYYVLTHGGVSVERSIIFIMFTMAINLLLSIYTTSMIGSLVGGMLGGLL